MSSLPLSESDPESLLLESLENPRRPPFIPRGAGGALASRIGMSSNILMDPGMTWVATGSSLSDFFSFTIQLVL